MDHNSPPDVETSDPAWDALSRYIAGESDPREAEAVQSWLASRPADDLLTGAVKDHTARAEASAAMPVNVDAAFAQVRARLAADAPRQATDALSVLRGDKPRAAAKPVAIPARRPAWGRVVVGLAAAAVAVAGLRQWLATSSPTMAERVLATRVGQRDSLTLSDGSKVVLAPGSRLTVAADFDAGNRVVTLDGAAFFDVRHDEAHPFTVRASRAEIVDVGTAFTVKTDEAGDVAVAVTHGIVALRDASADARVELHAGDRGLVRAGTVDVTRGSVTEEETAWTRGQLSFRDTPLSEVRADLRRWYGVTLDVQDSALARLTVTMPAQSDSATVMKTIAFLLGADMVQRGDTIVLTTAGRGTRP